jgi:4'-phosphopantetheinyl transferase
VRLELPALRDSPLPGVRVAWADLDDPQQAEAELETCLSPEERERARRFRFERDRRRYVVTHAVLRCLLAQDLDLEPGGVEIVADALGKPRLGKPTAGLAFNLSHTGARALFALGRDVELGVDAEALKPLADMPRLARDVFAPEELAEWEALPEAQRTLGFYSGWTRKEAVVKALGRGLDYPLAAFSVSLTPGRPAELRRAPVEAGPPSAWSVAALSPEPGYVAAVVARRQAAR